MSATDDILAQIDDAIEDWSVGPDAMRSGAPAGAGLMSRTWNPPPRTTTVMVQVDVQPFIRAMQQFAREMAKVARVFERMVQDSPELRKLLGLPRRDEHHPPSLSIDGAAYHRRRNARRRRR